jgi:uncharacterized protein (TIGR02186 family)
MHALVVGLLMAMGVALGHPFQQVPEPVDRQAMTELSLEPSEIRAGMFFDGATFRVSALVPEGMGITISCVGATESVTLNRKGKALGLIWMNVGEVEFDAAPDLYLLHASGELSRMAEASVLETLGVGYAALEHRITVKGAEGDEGRFFRELVSLKESEGLYSFSESAVEEEAQADGMVRVRTDLHLSPKTPPGEYQVLIHGFREGVGSLLGTAPIRVEQVGMAASIRNLAMEHGLSYGILAVAVAILVGLLTGVLFGLGTKKAH